MRTSILLSAFILSSSMVAWGGNNITASRNVNNGHVVTVSRNNAPKLSEPKNIYNSGFDRPNNMRTDNRGKNGFGNYRPSNSVVISHNHRDYLYADGNFYRDLGHNRVERITPCVGMRVPYLPNNYRVINRRGVKLYAHGNIVYRLIGSMYEIVDIMR